MELIKPLFEIVPQEYTLDGMKKHIEKCARVCYKSEHLIKDGNAEAFVDRMIQKKHTATLEHGTIYLIIPPEFSNEFYCDISQIDTNKYTVSNFNCNDSHLYITTNYRVIIENKLEKLLAFISEPTEFHEKRVTVRFNSSIHFYKDLTRHRPMSYCIESTRYCNYFKDKFGKSIKFTLPCWVKEEERVQFERDCQKIEDIYFSWIERGWEAQQAAYFLCQGVDADIYVTGFVRDWEHIFNLRADSHAHPVLQELMYPLKDSFVKLGYINNYENK